MKKAVIYARYSSVNQNEQSIEGQIKDCTAFAENNDIQIVEVYADKAQTGTNDNRADFQRMLKDCEKHTFDHIIVWKIDRFGRNREEITMNKMRCKKHHVSILYAMEHIPDGASGILYESLLEGMAEYYSKNLSENVKRGMRDNALKCKSNGGIRAFGYTTNEESHIVAEPKEAIVVQSIFARYLNGDTMSEIARWLNENKICTPLGGKFAVTTIGYILRNEKYKGFYIYDIHKIEGGVPRIIDDITFERVQKMLKANVTKRRKCTTSIEFLLTGKLYCGHCKSPMSGDSGTSRNGQKHYYYTCIKRKKEHICDKKSVRKEYIERLVIDKTLSEVLTPERIKEIAQGIFDKQKEKLDVDLVKNLEIEVKDCKKSLQNIQNAIEKGIILPDTQERVLSLTDTINECEIEIAKAKIKKPVLSLEQIEYWLYSFANKDVSDENVVKEIINEFISRIYLYDDKIIITYCNNNGEIALNEIKDIEIAIGNLGSTNDTNSCSFVNNLAPQVIEYSNICLYSYGFALAVLL